ncbi:MAG: glutamate-5-semialdehyde dehydrogenase [Deltaproteobacteria bacterium]|nr:glutamate-5-semialdehyde dehydrogenase [Deltaproteobacteria bacterium]
MKIEQLAKKCRASAPALSLLSTETKNKVLREIAAALRGQSAKIIAANNRDVKVAKRAKLSAAMIDRLMLNEKRIAEMAHGLEEVAALPDPVGQIVKEWKRPNGLTVKRKRIPLGVIAMVYESRPNVTVDAAGLCFKSGNAVVLRGGSESFHSNRTLGKLIQEVLQLNGVPKEAVSVVPTTDRKALLKMLKLSDCIDVVIPRGGEGLMRFMEEHSKIPVIKHDKGVCNLYVDASADLKMAETIIENSKVQRPGVCNALENLFVHKDAAASFLPKIATLLSSLGVELRGDPASRKIVPNMKKASTKDWETEYLDLILSVGVVKDVDDAIRLIRKYGSRHTESIITRDQANAKKFVDHLDSSCVMVNASTRFNDGGELGLGAEIGISTSKLHAYGPMGLEELTTLQFVVEGEGQIR